MHSENKNNTDMATLTSTIKAFAAEHNFDVKASAGQNFFMAIEWRAADMTIAVVEMSQNIKDERATVTTAYGKQTVNGCEELRSALEEAWRN